MIKFEHAEVIGWEAAIRGMRNPMNSWEKGDSCLCGDRATCDGCHFEGYMYGDRTIYTNRCDEAGTDQKTRFSIGNNDYDLMKRLRNAGTDHRKFMRMITVYCDILAPLYWWKEFDTYKVGTVANSCSTMHKIAEKEFSLEDFSHEHLTGETDGLWVNADGRDFMCSAYDFMQITCDVLNYYRQKYLETKDKNYWWQMIQLLPSSYNQKRTVMMNYEVLANIYKSRKGHKLDEWNQMCDWIKTLPYSELITEENEDKRLD